jgi:hypothetical protein
VALEKHGASGFLVTVDGCHNLEGSELLMIVEHLCDCLVAQIEIDREGSCAHPVGDRKGKL